MKPDVLEREARLNRRGERARARRRDDLGLHLEEREQVVQIQRLSGHLREPGEQAFEQRAQSPERAGQKREVADGEVAPQRAPRDEPVGHVVAHRPDRREQPAPQGPAPRQRAIGAIEALGQRLVALDEKRVETEDLHFLGGLDAGAGLPHVVQLAALGRAAVVERVAARVEVHLAEKRRDQRDQQQHDQPRGVRDEADGEADDGDDVLRLAEQLPEQRQAAAGLPPRALQAVLQLAVLEVLEIERRGVLHQAHAGGIREALRQQRIDQRHGAAEHVGEHGQPELQDEQPDERVEQPGVVPGAQALRWARQPGKADHLVDDQLADIQRDHRQQRPEHPQREVGDGQRGRGLPDEREEGRQVAERADAFTQSSI